MNVTDVHLEGFMVHAETSLTLPARGVVLVTGPNGSGKSGLVEAVAVAGWGRTLRGTDPWAGAGQVHLVADKVVVTRRRIGGKTVLVWGVGEQQPVRYENTTKAQEALEQVIGPFDIWRRTHVFSSQDAAHFTMATDSERKRLLEAILGLDRFDGALAACRADLKGAVVMATKAAGESARQAAALAGLNDRVADARKVLAALPPEVDVEALRKKARLCANMAREARNDIAEAERSMRAGDAGVAKLEAQAQETLRRLRALHADICDRCGQAIPQAMRDPLDKQAKAEQAQVAKARAEAKQQAQELQERVDELDAERQALEDKATALNSTAATAEAMAGQRTAAEQTLTDATGRVEAASTAVAAAIAEEAVQRHRQEVLEAVEQVLGLKGVRAHVLGRALSGLEAAANAWMARIAGPGLVLRLSSYTEKKSGGVSDSISLQVDGAGGGFGYKASSAGERRRVDVAMLLALSEVAAAAAGTTPGTLFFDEVFDALDEEGVDAVRDALVELAEDRVVVVITHNKAMVDRVPAALRVRVQGGKVQVM